MRAMKEAQRAGEAATVEQLQAALVEAQQFAAEQEVAVEAEEQEQRRMAPVLVAENNATAIDAAAARMSKLRENARIAGIAVTWAQGRIAQAEAVEAQAATNAKKAKAREHFDRSSVAAGKMAGAILLAVKYGREWQSEREAGHGATVESAGAQLAHPHLRRFKLDTTYTLDAYLAELESLASSVRSPEDFEARIRHRHEQVMAILGRPAVPPAPGDDDQLEAA